MYLPVNLTYRLLLWKPGSDARIYNSNTYVKNYTYLGTVEEADGKRPLPDWNRRTKFSVGETIEIMKPDGRKPGGGCKEHL